MFLRLDVDHCCFNKYLSYIRLTTGLFIPTFLNHVKTMREYLENNHPHTKHIWMFRPRTSPSSWNEEFGLHSRGFYYFPKEYKQLTRKLGDFKYFNRHGFAPFASGTLWTPAMIQVIEKKFSVIDLTSKPYVSVDLASEAVFNSLDFSKLHHVNFHPCHFHSHFKILKKTLDLIEKALQKSRRRGLKH